jgi:isocitrate/isopropylmalate dehydrogenase
MPIREQGWASVELADEGRVRTYDMGGNDSTLDVAKAIAEYASS